MIFGWLKRGKSESRSSSSATSPPLSQIDLDSFVLHRQYAVSDRIAYPDIYSSLLERRVSSSALQQRLPHLGATQLKIPSSSSSSSSSSIIIINLSQHPHKHHSSAQRLKPRLPPLLKRRLTHNIHRRNIHLSKWPRRRHRNARLQLHPPPPNRRLIPRSPLLCLLHTTTTQSIYFCRGYRSKSLFSGIGGIKGKWIESGICC